MTLRRNRDECPRCREDKVSTSKYCRRCTASLNHQRIHEKSVARDADEVGISWVPGACLDCGIRPLEQYDLRDRMLGWHVVTVIDGYCDDCHLRMRRDRQYDEGVPSRFRSHTPVAL